MRTRSLITRLLVVAGAAAALMPQVAYAQAPLGTAFSYAGLLSSGGQASNGSFDLRFRLYTAENGGVQLGSTLCLDNAQVTNGKFVVLLDFGTVFNGQKQFLEIDVRQDAGADCFDGSGYSTLTPRQELTGTPNALFAQNAATATTADTAITATSAINADNTANAATLNGQSSSYYRNAANLTGTVPSSGLSGTYSGAMNLSNPANTYVGNGSELTLLSASNISTGTLSAARMPSNWAAGGDLTGFFPAPVIGDGAVTLGKLAADVQSLLGSTVENWANPTLAGSVGTGDQPDFVAVSGSYAYVVNQISNTLQVFDVTNPAAPALAGSIGTGPNSNGVAVSGSYAFVVNQDSDTLQVFDVSNPSAPALAGSVGTGDAPVAVTVSGSYAYVTNIGSSTLQIFDVSNPAAPALAGSAATGTVPLSVAVSGSHAYVANQNSDNLQVFDVSNPAAPTSVGVVGTGAYPHSVAISGSYLYVVNYGSSTLQVFNISNPASPTLAGSTTTDILPTSVGVSGSNAFVVNQLSNTLQVFDVSNPAAPALMGSAPTGSEPFAVAASGSHAYVVNYASNTLQVFSPQTYTSYDAASRFGQSVSVGGASVPTQPGLAVAGIGSFAGTVSASSFTGSGAGLTGLNASNITTGTLNMAQIPNLDASKITTGTLDDARYSSNVALRNSTNAFTNPGASSFAGNLGVGTAAPQGRLDVASGGGSYVRVDGLGDMRFNGGSDGNVGFINEGVGSGGTEFVSGGQTRIRINNASGNVGIGTASPTNRLSVNGNADVSGSVTAASYAGSGAGLTGLNASNVTTGTIAQAVLPVSSWADASLGANSITSSGGVYTTVGGTSQAFPMRQGVAVISWSTSAMTTATNSVYNLRIKAVTGGVTTFGPVIAFAINAAGPHIGISGNAVVTIPSTATTTFTLEVTRASGAGAYTTDVNDSFSATIINIGQ
jgi:hypothetical protein